MSSSSRPPHWLFWAYLSDKGQLLPATIREKAGDADSALYGRCPSQRPAQMAKYKRVRVRVMIEKEFSDEQR
jgi:hypothetical protein